VRLGSTSGAIGHTRAKLFSKTVQDVLNSSRSRMCLASASVRQCRLFPQEREDFFNRPKMIGNARFHRRSDAQRLMKSGRNCNACNEAQRRVPNFLAFSRSRLSAEFQTVPLPKIRTNRKAGHLSLIFVSRSAHPLFFLRTISNVRVHTLIIRITGSDYACLRANSISARQKRR